MEGGAKMNKIPSEIDLEDIFNQPINDQAPLHHQQDVKVHPRITPPGFADAAVVYCNDHHSQIPAFPFPDQVYLTNLFLRVFVLTFDTYVP